MLHKCNGGGKPKLIPKILAGIAGIVFLVVLALLILDLRRNVDSQ